MLRRLHIRNYVLMDSLEVSFPEGLVIVTGQTGAGKSILLGALSLLTGAKADAGIISANADNCVVEGEFRVNDPSVRDILEAADIDFEQDEGSLILRRVVSKSGRSRGFVNDCPVPASLLQELSPLLVDIHSQHKSLLLTDKSFQLSALDAYAGCSDALERCSELWRRTLDARSEIKSLSGQLSSLRADEDYNRARWERLESAKLREGELSELEQEQKQLANASFIKQALRDAVSSMESDDSIPRAGVLETLKDSSRNLAQAGKFIPGAVELAARLDSARLEIADILDEARGIDEGIVSSEERLQAVDDRLGLLYSLMSSYSCSSETELIEKREELSHSLFDVGSLEERVADAQKRLSALETEFGEVCGELHALRENAAPSFAEKVSESLHFLELERAVFELRLENCEAGAKGSDRVTFLFSSTGAVPEDVSKCASGGEISRIMLSLKAMMAKHSGMPTLVFDEIDTGVSGSVADRMGRMICTMGKDMQVISITHLPQVAAKGQAHFVVSKAISADGRTISGIREVSGKERVMEIARLLSGSSITDAAVANAESLLEES